MRAKLQKKSLAGSCVQIAGSGDPLVVLHGGPGLDHSYLVEWLLPLSKRRQLVFFDQRGCGQDRTPLEQVTASALVDQFVALVRHLQQQTPVGVFAHSWGSYILYQAIEGKSSGLVFSEAILSSPVGLTRKRFDESGERLIARVPQQALIEIEAREKEHDGIGVMRAALPYYVSSPGIVPPVAFGFYDPVVYGKVMETLGPYDFRKIVDVLPKATFLIYGDNDIEVPQATKEIHKKASVTIVENAGHFAFAEQPESFSRIVNRLLDA